MAIQMTREEYRRIYGVEPTPTNVASWNNDPAPRQMTRAEYEAEFFPKPVSKTQEVLEGRPAFPANTEGGVGENLARYTGNIPGAAYNLAKFAVSPVNPFDTESPFNIGKNIVESAIALKDIYKQRGLKGTKDIASGTGSILKTGLNYLKQAGQSIYQNLEQNVLSEDSVAKGVGVSVAQGVSKAAELAINDPTFFPTLLYTPGKVIKGADLISDTARPVIKTTQNVTKFKTPTVIEKTADEIANIENNYVKLRKANTFEEDAGQASRMRIAQSNVLAGSVDTEGTIRTLLPGGAVDKYRNLVLDGYESVVKNNLKLEGAVANLEDVGQALTAGVYRSGLEGADLLRAINGLKKEIQGLALRADEGGNILLDKLQDIKISTTKQINYKTDPTPAITYRKTKARVYKELIEEHSNVKVEVNGKMHGIRDINAELAKYYEDIERLVRLDGRKVKGGKLGKYFAQISGNIIGGAAGAAVGGGMAGAAIGAVVGGESAGLIKGRMMSSVFKNAREGSVPRNPILDVAKAQGRGVDLRVPSEPVKIPTSIKKTKEMSKLEKDIERNVLDQKAAIKKGDFALVAALKEIYDVLVEKLKKLIQRIKDTPNKQGGFADYSYNLGNRNMQYNKTPTATKISISGKNTTKAPEKLSTKFLSYIDEKLAKDPNATLSRQEILDFAKRPELKKGEADLLLKKLEEFDGGAEAQQRAKSVRELAQRFADDEGGGVVKDVYLVGSRARKTQGATSDWDFVVVGDNFDSLEKAKISRLEAGERFEGLALDVPIEKRARHNDIIFSSTIPSNGVRLSDKLPAQDFADSIRRDLLELKPVKVKEPQYDRISIDEKLAKDIHDRAIAYQKEFVSKVTNIVERVGLEVEHGPVKSVERLLEKAKNELGGNINAIGDVNRSVVFVSNFKDVGRIVTKMSALARKEFGGVERIKIDIGLPSYKKVIMNVPTKVGQGEIQITTRELWDAKTRGGGHILYALERGGKSNEGVRALLRQRMEEIYALDPNSIFRKAERASNEGGFTADLLRNVDYAGTPHIAVSPFPERTVQYSGATTGNVLADFLDKNIDLLSQKGYSMGGWFNKESKTTYLDVVIPIEKRFQQDAMSLGREANQIAIFDLENFVEIPTGGTGKIEGATELSKRIKMVNEILGRQSSP